MPKSPSATDALPALPDTAICLKCGYSLRGLPEPRCPECGREFDPADPETCWEPARGALARYAWSHGWPRPPTWRARTAILATLLFIELVHFWPMCFPLMAIPILTLSLIGAAHLVHAWGLSLCPWSRWNRPDLKQAALRMRRRILPGCIAAILCAPLLPPLSLPFMEWKAGQVIRYGPDSHPGIVGMLPVSRVAPLEDGRVKFEAWPAGRPHLVLLYYPLFSKRPLDCMAGLWGYYWADW